jgi:hypothetical protein
MELQSGRSNFEFGISPQHFSTLVSSNAKSPADRPIVTRVSQQRQFTIEPVEPDEKQVSFIEKYYPQLDLNA